MPGDNFIFEVTFTKNLDEPIFREAMRDLDQLSRELIRARERLRHKRDIIKACSRQCGYAI